METELRNEEEAERERIREAEEKAYLRITSPIMPEGMNMTPDTLVVKCSHCGTEVFRIKGISALQFRCRPRKEVK